MFDGDTLLGVKDMELLWNIQHYLRTPFLDVLFSWITRLGEETILIVVFCLVFWCINKRTGYMVGISFFFSALIVQGMKIIFQVPRPWVTDPNILVLGAETAATGYAFPSGHTQNAAAWLGALAISTKKTVLRYGFIILALLVGFSRLYLGVHFLSDVLVSLVISGAVVVMVHKMLPSEFVSKKKELILPIIIASFATIVVAVIAYLYLTGSTIAPQLRDAAIASGAAYGFAIGMYVERVYIQFSPKMNNVLLQAVKFVLGVVGAVALLEGLRFIGSGLIATGARYFFVVIWILIIYPLIIKKFFNK